MKPLSKPPKPLLSPTQNHIFGIVVIIVELLATMGEWLAVPDIYLAGGVCAALCVLLAMRRIGFTAKAFATAGLLLFVTTVLTHPDWAAVTLKALRSSAFIIGFFVALTWLRSAALTSSNVDDGGRYLAEQPPGRRYVALTIGGQMFGSVLLFGALSLLGSLAESSARKEPDDTVRNARLRRMLVAIQRGVNVNATWSPLTFSVGLTTAIVPGATWAAIVWPGIVSGLILAVLGWALDASHGADRTGTPPPPRVKNAGMASLRPMVALLAIVMIGAGAGHILTGQSVVAVVMLLVPILSLVWIGLQAPTGSGKIAHVARQGRTFVLAEMPAFQSEIVMMAMAGFIGTMGAALLGPVVAESGLDLTQIPPWALILALLWLMPITGQFGMNPILAASLFAPLLPDAAALGLSPAILVLAITGGWALSGISSPFSASTLIVGALVKKSAFHVGFRWNGLFAILGGVFLSVWLLLLWWLGV